MAASYAGDSSTSMALGYTGAGEHMVQVHFTSHLRHVAPNGAVAATGATIGEVLADVFARHPDVKGYVLDDQGRVRVHIAVFLDNAHIRHGILDQAVTPTSELYILQALSGG